MFPSTRTELPNIPSGSTHRFGPGAYGVLRARTGQTYELQAPGTYFFESVDIDPGGNVRFNNTAGPIFVYIRDGFVHEGALLKTNAAYNLQVAVSGSSDVKLLRAFTGTLVAPRATVELASLAFGAAHRGAIYARKINMHPNAKLFLRPLALDCAQEQAACRQSSACPLEDSDGDQLPDCEEASDDAFWTNPEEANGVFARWDDSCSFVSGQVCGAIDERGEVDACLAGEPIEQRSLSSGWEWQSVLSTASCDPGHAAMPPTTQCGVDATFHAQGTLYIERAGTHCFAVPSSNGGACGVLFVGDATDGVTSDDGAACFQLESGPTAVRWFRASAAGAKADFLVAYCEGGTSSCSPTEPIPVELLRVGACGENECSPGCPCDAGQGTCTEDVQCKPGLVCVEGNGPLNNQPVGTSVCGPVICETTPWAEGCYSAPLFCEDDADCPNSESCEPNGLRYGYHADVSICVDHALCDGPDADNHCGTLDSRCGFCQCVPDCTSKQCGDSAHDGCGGTCNGYCATGASGCVLDVECEQGSVCIGGTCVDPRCGTTDCDSRLCPDGCGQCVPQCGGQQCGTDPECGVSCGTCGAGTTCQNGMCTADEQPRPEIPPHPGPDPHTATIGATPGTFALSPVGRPTYTIPIDVLPGRGGVGPTVSLSYAGAPTVGVAGVGWNLNAGSVINRCRKSLAVDGWSEGPKGVATDAFCLDGQRLILVGGQPGEDGARYRTEFESFNEITYRRTSEHDYWEVRSKDGSYWRYGVELRTYMITLEPHAVQTNNWPVTDVTNRAGVVTHYTHECRGRISYLNGGNWCLANPKLLSIEYGARPGGQVQAAENHLHRVTFSYEPNIVPYFGLTPAFGATQELNERLSAISVGFGDLTERTYRLQYGAVGGREDFLLSVRECAGDGSDGVCLGPTTFTYANTGDEMFAPEVQDTVELVPRTFGGGPVKKTDEERETQSKALPTIMGDFNGDGMLDFVHPKTGGGLGLLIGRMGGSGQLFDGPYDVPSPMQCVSQSSVGDFDLDGRADLLEACPMDGGAIRIWIATGDPQAPFAPWLLHLDVVADTTVFPMDANDDGIPDVVGCATSGASKIWLMAPGATVEGTLSVPQIPSGVRSCSWQSSASREHPTPLLLDVDGSGAANWLVRSDDATYALAIDPAGAGNPPTLAWRLTGLDSSSIAPRGLLGGPMRPMDINGDGLRDVLEHVAYLDSGVKGYRTSDADPSDLVVTSNMWFNNANYRFDRERAFIPKVEDGIYEPDPTQPDGVSGEFFELARVSDFDRDGRDELLSLVNTGAIRQWVVLDSKTLAEPKQWVQMRATPISSLPTETRWVEDGMAPMLHDFDGDGAVDALFFDGSVFRLHRGLQPERYLLESVEDGLGNEIQITYSVNSANYSSEQPCDGQTRCLPRAGALVEKIATSNANHEDEGHTQISYTDFRFGLHGRGPLGFRARTTTDYDPNGVMIRSVTEEYDNGQQYDPATRSYPFVGRLSKTTTVTAAVDNGLTDPPGGPVPKTSFRTEGTYSYELLTSDAGRPFVVPRLFVTRQSQLFEGEKELTVTSISYAENGVSGFDMYGNSRFQRTSRGGPSGDGTSETLITRSSYYPRGQRNDNSPGDPARWETGLLRERSVHSRGKIRQTRFAYDEATGQLAATTRAPGSDQRTTTLTRDDVGNVTGALVAADGETKSMAVHFDALGLRPVGVTGPTGLGAHVDADLASGRVLAEVDPNRRATQYVYDRFGRRTRVITPTGESFAQLLPSYYPNTSYSVYRSQKDGTGAETALVESQEFLDSRGRVRTSLHTGLDGVTIEKKRTYDSAGRLATEELPHPTGASAPGVISYVYDELGSLRHVTTPGDEGEPASVESYYYATRYTTPGPLMPDNDTEQSRTVYVAQKLDADGVTTTTFSGALQEAVMRRRGSGADREQTRITYGAFGVVDAYYGASNTMRMQHDDWGRLLSVEDSDLGTVTYSYDAFDRMTSSHDADGRETTYDYDLLDRITVASHEGSLERFVYDRDVEAEQGGEPVTVNSLGRLVRAVRETPNGTFTETFRYEAPPSNDDPRLNTALLERVKLAVPGEQFETRYEYVPSSTRLLVHHYPQTDPTMPFGVTYCYDAVGSPTAVFDAEVAVDCGNIGTGPAPFWKRTSVKDGLIEDGYELGNTVSVELDLDPNTYRLSGHSIQATNTAVGFGYSYEAGGRLAAESRTGALNSSRDYGYADSGVLAQVAQDNQVLYNPVYNGNLQLESGPSNLGTFTYEGADGAAVGNRVKQVDAAPGAPDPTPTTFEYDGRGNQTLRAGPEIPGGRQVLSYNDFNLPDTIVTGTGSDAFTVAFDYDALGQRVRTQRPESELWHFAGIYEKEAMLADPDTSEEHRYWVFARGKRLAQITRSQSAVDDTWSETTDYFHYDRLGSVIAMSNAGGNITSEMDYGIYGEPKQALPTVFGYTGHRHEQDLGLVDANGRFYDPKFGVFLSADPLSAVSGGSPRMNRYAYVGYDPVNFVDPSGYEVVTVGLVIVGVALVLLVPTANLMVNDEFSYTWNKNTHKGVIPGLIALGAGLVCGASGGPVVGIACGGAAGFLAGGVSAALNGADAGGILSGAVMGAFMGLASGGVGYGASQLVAFTISTNPYVIATLTTAATTGASAGFQAATGQEIDWGQVAIQGMMAGLFALARAYDDVNTAEQLGASAGRAAGRASNPSKGFQLAQGPTDRALGSFERGSGPLIGHVVDSEGRVRGNLHVVEYERAPGGARLVLRYDDIDSGAEKLNWLQTVDTTHPSPGSPNPMLDNGNWSHGTALYFTDAELAEYSFADGSTLYFHDYPQRREPALWVGELSLVGRFPGSPHYNSLVTVTWGFSPSGAVLPLRIVEPSAFHVDQLP